MKSIGIKLGPNRLSHYEKIISYWQNSYKTATKEEAENEFLDFVSSIFEVHDFISIYDAFKHTPKSKLLAIISKLQKGVNGPINAADETPDSTTARNYIFEALVAARVHRPKNGIETILNAKSDTGFKICNKKVWVECKRITTEGRIEANARKASRQLESIIANQVGSGHRGIVAIDVSKILNTETPESGGKMLVRYDDNHLLESVDSIMDSFIHKYSDIWQNVYLRRNRKIIGTIIRFSFMATSEQRNLLVHTSQWAANPRRGITEADKSILKLFVSAVKNDI